jgi:hypothetical protein
MVDSESNEEFLKKQKEKVEAIKMACRDFNYEWPKSLWTGVMYYRGHNISVKEFNDWARNFK